MTVLKLIRLNVFGVDQVGFAAIVGVTQGTVSRWEHGMEPSLTNLSAIRYAAMSRGLPWSDSWFFAPPPCGLRRRARRHDE